MHWGHAFFILVAVLLVVLIPVLTVGSSTSLERNTTVKDKVEEKVEGKSPLLPPLVYGEPLKIAEDISNYDFTPLVSTREKCRAVVLVIVGTAAGEYVDLYVEFQRIWRAYSKLNSNYRVMFLECDPNADELIQWSAETQTMRLKTIEIFRPGIILKTIAGMALATQLYEFQYLIRTNLSTFLNWHQFDVVLDELPIHNVYAGCKNLYGNISFCSCAVTLSQDNVQKILTTVAQENPALNWMLPDDVFMGYILTRDKDDIQSIPGGWYITNVNIDEELEAQLQTDTTDLTFSWYRVRTPDSNRFAVDTYIHEYLFNAFYSTKPNVEEKVQEK